MTMATTNAPPDLLRGTVDLADPADPCRRPAPRLRHRAAPAHRLAGRPASRRELALPVAPAPAGEWLGQGRVGHVGQQPPRALLHDDSRRTETPRGRARRVRAPDWRDDACHGTGVTHEPPSTLLRLACQPRTRADEEVEAHRALVEEELRRAGFPAADAAAESRRRLGNVTLAREDSREVWTLRWLDQLRQYLRYGARGLRREPLFALTAILSLALGTAATRRSSASLTPRFWRPLPSRIPTASWTSTLAASRRRTDIDGISLEELPGLATRARAREPRGLGLATPATPPARSRRIAARHRRHVELLLHPRPYRALGRVFTDDDARGTTTAILTERGWTRSSTAAPTSCGRTVTLDVTAVRSS